MTVKVLLCEIAGYVFDYVWLVISFARHITVCILGHRKWNYRSCGSS